jgi:poly(A) polymerase
MNRLLDKILLRTNNLDYISLGIKNLTINTPANKIFNAINNHSDISEIRYVGGCVRKIINKENVDDIDLATNLNPKEVSSLLKKNNINFYETGIEHGTITAVIDDYKFEITSLREDFNTDGRHAKVNFSTDWKRDASRRDFSINSIYADANGNLFDPFNGKKDLENGLIRFIGDPEERIKEDYLRILRYLRFFLNYSNQKHDQEILRVIRKNLSGISNLSKERLFDELKKFIKSKVLEKLSNDKYSIELIEIIFPQLKKIGIFKNPNSFAKVKLEESDVIFLLSLLIIDESDNLEFFIYKFNISKKDQKRLKIINNFFNEKISTKSFSERNLNKLFYYNGKQAVIDILSYKLFVSKKIDKKFIDLLEIFTSKIMPTMPINAKILMSDHNIPEGKTLGNKLKMIEEEWVDNNFELSDKQINKIINR